MFCVEVFHGEERGHGEVRREEDVKELSKAVGGERASKPRVRAFQRESPAGIHGGDRSDDDPGRDRLGPLDTARPDDER